LTETRFEGWARQESFTVAKEKAYRNGQLRGSKDQQNGEVFPADYIATVKPIAERRVVLAGYRLADVLTQTASQLTDIAPTGIAPTTASDGTVQGNKRSKVYHLAGCPGFDTMSAANIITFSSEAEAEHAGYRKAKHCP
jgi:hypothetical protein